MVKKEQQKNNDIKIEGVEFNYSIPLKNLYLKKSKKRHMTTKITKKIIKIKICSICTSFGNVYK